MIRNLLLCLFLALALPATALAEGGKGLTPVDGRPAAPGFALPDLDGKTLKLSDLSGKVVVVNFWATWCPPCRAEMPSLQRLSKSLADKGVVVVGIHVGGNADQVWDYAAADGLDFPLVIDADSAVIQAWPVKGLPTTFVVDRAGRLAFQAIGGREWDDAGIVGALEALAAEKGPPT